MNANPQTHRDRFIEFVAKQTGVSASQPNAPQVWKQYFSDVLHVPSERRTVLNDAIQSASADMHGGKIKVAQTEQFLDQMSSFFRSSGLESKLILGADLSYNKVDTIGRFIDQTFKEFARSKNVTNADSLQLFWRRTKIVELFSAQCRAVPLTNLDAKGSHFVWRRDFKSAMEEYTTLPLIQGLMKQMARDKKKLEMIFRGDAMDMKDTTLTLFTVGFPSFGLISKSPYLLMPIAAATGSDKDIDKIREWLGDNVQKMQEVIDTKSTQLTFLKRDGTKTKIAWPVKFRQGGDDPFQRTCQCYTPSGGMCKCKYCFAKRTREDMEDQPGAGVPAANLEPENVGTRPGRREELHKRRRDKNDNPCTRDLGYGCVEVDGKQVPAESLLDLDSAWDVVIDNLHGLLCFGKLILRWMIVKYLKFVQLVVNSVDKLKPEERMGHMAPFALWVIKEVKCKALGRKIAKGKPLLTSVLRGIKGKQARRLFAAIESFRDAGFAEVTEEEVEAIRQTRRLIKSLFIHPEQKNFKNDRAKFDRERDWAKTHGKQIMEEFGRICDNGDKNYIHEFGDHIEEIFTLYPDGIHLYATDVQETLNAIFSSGRKKWSNNGGGKQTSLKSSLEWIPQVLKRFLLKQKFLLSHPEQAARTIINLSQKRVADLTGADVQ